MASAQQNRVLRHFVGFRETEAPDAALLERFTSGHEEAAFTVLVKRHGAMVLAVARRMLGSEPDAEDVFQATFLLLARKAATIRKTASVGSWLHGVAHRLALKLKAQQACRRAHEKRAADRPRTEPGSESAWSEVQAALDAALRELPDRYRTALVLCCLEGKTHPAAARILDCAPATVGTWIARGRRLLRDRLAARGFTLSTAGLAALLLANTATGAASAALVKGTVRIALQFAAGQPAAAVCSRPVAQLMEKGLLPMFLTKSKLVTAVLAIAGLIMGTASMMQRVTGGNETEKPKAATTKPQAGSDRQPPATRGNESIVCDGIALRPDGKPAAGVQIWLATPKSEEQEDDTLVATTDDAGRFHSRLPAAKPGTMDSRQLVVRAGGLGADWVEVADLRPNQQLTLKLVKADVAVRGRVLTLEGKPVEGVKVSIHSVAMTPGGDLAPLFKFWTLDTASALRAASKELRFPGAAGLPRQRITDAQGRFEVPGVGDNRLLAVKVEHDSLEHTFVRIVTIAGFNPKSAIGSDKPLMQGEAPPLYGPECDHVARPTLAVSGVVRDRSTGKPISNVRVSGAVVNGWRENSTSATTDAAGRYRLVGLPKAAQCRLSFSHTDKDTSYFGRAIILHDIAGLAPATADMGLSRGVVVTGRVTDEESGQPVPGRVRYAPLKGNKTLEKLAGLDVHANGDLRPDRVLTYPLDGDGRFRFVAPPGLGVILVQAESRAVAARPYTQAWLSPSEAKQPYAVTIPDFPQMLSRADGLLELLRDKNAYRVIDPANGTESLTADFALDPGKTVTGRVVDEGGKAVAGAFVAGLTAAQAEAVTLQDHSFIARALDPSHPRMVAVIHRERKLAGTLVLRGDEKDPPVVRLQSWGYASGQVVDVDGNPQSEVGIAPFFRNLTAQALYYGKLHSETELFLSDRDGRYRLDIPFTDQPFSLIALSRKFRPLDTGGKYETWTVSPGKVKEVPPITVRGPLEP
jgi:RNA polymerase sigma factor (sigma-70 family)